MVMENINQPFKISFQELEGDPVPENSYNFFELFCIIHASGKQCINIMQFNYSKEHFFLLTLKTVNLLKLKRQLNSFI